MSADRPAVKTQHRIADTSREAAAAQPAKKAADRARIKAHVEAAGPDGATREEIALALDLLPQTCTPRCTELVDSGELVQLAAKRPTRSGVGAHVLVSPDQAGLRWRT